MSNLEGILQGMATLALMLGTALQIHDQGTQDDRRHQSLLSFVKAVGDYLKRGGSRGDSEALREKLDRLAVVKPRRRWLALVFAAFCLQVAAIAVSGQGS